MQYFTVFLILVSSLLLCAQDPQLIPYRKVKLWGYSNPERELIIQPKWQETTFFKSGVARVKQDNKWGLIDEKGNTILPTDYEFILVGITLINMEQNIANNKFWRK